MNYNVKRKGLDGKFQTYGNVKTNQWGNLSLGMRATEQLKKLVAETPDGGWINFSLFDAEQKPGGDARRQPAAPANDVLDDEIPF